MPNLTFQQFTGLSCGAACLLVAAKELGIAQMPDMTGSGVPNTGMWIGQPLELSNGCERAIYAVTANGVDTYSMPDGIARAGQMLGLDVSVSMSGCVVPKVLEWKYPNVRDQLDELGVEILSGTPALAENERMLVAVGIGGLGLHWVLYRSDGTYMDPAYARNYTCSLWGMGQLGVLRYIDTGIYVVVGTPTV
ncbi:hypothetical protein [Algicella marina]|uniref:Peptidase C39-like domain-containing protein n=1 Tax=Algicella marina TaxID=2683284 RepID=A0A6P1T206_9RHOB|nr:hypothetical protein [Algicella marina]QHQ35329.1 hypothetical protein GO499_09015 [Algicella marina]